MGIQEKGNRVGGRGHGPQGAAGPDVVHGGAPAPAPAHLSENCWTKVAQICLCFVSSSKGSWDHVGVGHHVAEHETNAQRQPGQHLLHGRALWAQPGLRAGQHPQRPSQSPVLRGGLPHHRLGPEAGLDGGGDRVQAGAVRGGTAEDMW